jgi:hypothetical protein
MNSKISQLKPGAPRSVHLFVAAIIWSCVGSFLFLRGAFWLQGIAKLWIILPGILFGTCKALWMLDRSAQKNIVRIVKGGNSQCLGGVYSWKTWLLVMLMMAMGCLLRNSSLPKEFLGLFYVSIGWGLLFASRKSWIAWIHEKKRMAETKM